MESFSDIQEEAREKLGRNLKEREIAFLEWIYQRYTEEMEDVRENY